MIVTKEYTATAERTAVRLVACEECDAQYVYELTRSAEGMGTSLYLLDNAGAEARAKRKAQAKLAEKMKNACEAVPCPKCGHYQLHMRSRARFQKALKWMLLAGTCGFLAFVSLVVALYSRHTMPGLMGFGLLLIPTLALGLVAIIVNSSYDPNKQPEDVRLEVAAEKAITRKAFEKGFVEYESDEFDKFRRKLAKKKTRKFPLALWADRRQVRDGERMTVRLPVGDKATVTLRSSAKEGDEYRVPAEVDGHEIDFVCVLAVYTKTKENR